MCLKVLLDDQLVNYIVHMHRR